MRDLLLHWPVIDDGEDDALELCRHIADAVYPLTAALHAQGVELEITLSSKPVEVTGPIDVMSTLLLLDAKTKQEIHHFISPEKPLPKNETLRIAKGVALLCKPLNYNYHTLQDDRERTDHPSQGIFELAQSMINAMYDSPAFIEQDRSILAIVKRHLQFLPENLIRAAAYLGAPKTAPHSADGMTGLPLNMRAMERSLMAYAMDKNLSANLRGGLRQVAQVLRGHSPQATFAESAHLETAKHAVKTGDVAKVTRSPDYHLLPKSAPINSIGRLDKIAGIAATNAAPLRHMAASPAPILGII